LGQVRAIHNAMNPEFNEANTLNLQELAI
jgi:hypothetical protein